MRPVGLLLLGTCALGGCATAHSITPSQPVVAAPQPVETGWRGMIDPEDVATLDALPATWLAGRAKVSPREKAALAAERGLLDATSALDHPALPPGSYNCRVIRMGNAAGPRGYRMFPPQFCFVRGETDGKLSFNKQTGSDLPNGWLYPDGDRRYVFLGAQQTPQGEAIAYGSDRSRDVVGVVERVGPFQWRLVVPRRDPAGLWVYELTPVPNAQQPG